MQPSIRYLRLYLHRPASQGGEFAARAPASGAAAGCGWAGPLRLFAIKYIAVNVHSQGARGLFNADSKGGGFLGAVNAPPSSKSAG